MFGNKVPEIKIMVLTDNKMQKCLVEITSYCLKYKFSYIFNNTVKTALV